jgi:manganese oxidase
LTRPAGTIPGIALVQPLLFQVWNEGASAYLTKNIAKYNPRVDTANPDFEEGNLKHSINGYLYCNMPDVSVLSFLLIGGALHALEKH